MGTLNLITPAKRKQAAGLVKEGAREIAAVVEAAAAGVKDVAT